MKKTNRLFISKIIIGVVVVMFTITTSMPAVLGQTTVPEDLPLDPGPDPTASPAPAPKSTGDVGKDCLADTGISALQDVIVGFISEQLNIGLGIITGGLLGGSKEVNDSKSQGIALKVDLKNCIRYVQEQLLKTALANFKKRLLDKLTDDVVAWIKDDGSGQPRFVDDFGGFLKDTANESLGQTIEQLGFSNLCSGSLSARLQLQLQQPAPFTQQVNCTLNDVIKNVGDFDRDFRAGGWVGYNEVLKPQNNRWGLEILATDQAAKLQAEKEEAARNDLNASGGYKSQKACYEWSRSVRFGYDDHVDIQFVFPSGISEFVWKDEYYNPNAGGSIPTTLSGGAVNATDWRCTQEKITIPGKTVGAITDQAVSSQNDSQLLANADDLTPYISAIFDAAINRLFRQGVQGLRSLGTNIYSDSGTGRPAAAWRSGGRYGGYGNEYGTSSDPRAQLKDAILKTIASTTARMRIASSSLLALSSPPPTLLTPLNNRLVASTTLLTNCEVLKTPDHVQCSTTGIIETNNTNRATIIQSQLDSLRTLSGQLQQVRASANDPAISVASLTELVAIVNNVYLSVENIINTIVPSFTFDINTVASSTVNPRLRACQAVGVYACPL